MPTPRLPVAALAVLALAADRAADPNPRQHYSPYWQKSGGYYYKTYYYRPTPTAAYRSHKVIYYPTKPRHYYYYNPSTKRYWGRHDLARSAYSKLAGRDQRERLADIPEGRFPPPSDMPAVPESADGAKMLPPDGGPPPVEAVALPVDEFRRRNPQPGDTPPPRQAFSGWCKQGGYYFCNYYCRPQPDGDYTVHRCVYYPDRPFIYYYNPSGKRYWGRYDLAAGGFSPLAEPDRAGRLADVPSAAFPAPAELPSVPGAADGTRMLAPPAPTGLTADK